MICHARPASATVPSSGSLAEPAYVMTSPTLYVSVEAGAEIVGTGGRLPTVMVTVAVPVPPRPSVSVSVAVYVPFAVYVCVGFGRFDAGVWSPKFQLYVSGSPSGSDEPALENC